MSPSDTNVCHELYEKGNIPLKRGCFLSLCFCFFYLNFFFFGPLLERKSHGSLHDGIPPLQQTINKQIDKKKKKSTSITECSNQITEPVSRFLQDLQMIKTTVKKKKKKKKSEGRRKRQESRVESETLKGKTDGERFTTQARDNE